MKRMSKCTTGTSISLVEEEHEKERTVVRLLGGDGRGGDGGIDNYNAAVSAETSHVCRGDAPQTCSKHGRVEGAAALEERFETIEALLDRIQIGAVRGEEDDDRTALADESFDDWKK